jgi:hypothetical protein
MKARSRECQTLTPLNDAELFEYEQRLHKETGKGIIHPNDFLDINVREAVKKHLDKKYGKLKK